MRRRLRSLVTAVVAASIAATGCTSGGSTSPGPALSEAEAVSAYGYGPIKDPDTTYHPDVVALPDGPRAIRGVSADRMVWILDGGAKGVADLARGKVLFASSDALGRVLRMERRGANVAVTLAPVALTEVVSEAHLSLDQRVGLDALEFREVPDLPGAILDTPTDTLNSKQTATGAAAHAVAGARRSRIELVADRSLVQAADAVERSKKVGNWMLTAFRGPETIGIRGERTAGGGGLKVNFEAHVEARELRVKADVPITRGVVGTSHFQVDGITGLAVSISAGAGNGLSDNRSVKLELPVTLTQRVIIGGLPATLTQKLKFLLRTAFTAKNGNLSASASWALDGPLGFDGTTLTTPTMTERDSLIESIAGVSVGVNGLVYGVAFEFGLLVGLPVAGAGPVASFITSIGITNGSDLGIVKCRQSSLTSNLTGGVGLSVYDPVKQALKRLWGIDVPAQKTLITKTILQESWYDPKIVACRP